MISNIFIIHVWCDYSNKKRVSLILLNNYHLYFYINHVTINTCATNSTDERSMYILRPTKIIFFKEKSSYF